MITAKMVMASALRLIEFRHLARNKNKIAEINEGGISTLLIEQNFAEAARLAHRMYLLEEGTIVLEGGREEVLSNEHVKEAFLGI